MPRTREINPEEDRAKRLKAEGATIAAPSLSFATAALTGKTKRQQAAAKPRGTAAPASAASLPPVISDDEKAAMKWIYDEAVLEGPAEWNYIIVGIAPSGSIHIESSFPPVPTHAFFGAFYKQQRVAELVAELNLLKGA